MIENRYQLTMNLGMSARYHQMAETFYLRVNDISLFINLVFSSAAVVLVLREHPMLAIGAAILVSVTTALSLTMGTVRKAQAHRDQYRRYVELEARAADMDERIFAAEIARIERDDEPVIEAFRKKAYIDNLRRCGHEEEAKTCDLDFDWLERLRLILTGA